MLGLSGAKPMAIIAGCAVFALVSAGAADAREGLRDGSRTKLVGQHKVIGQQASPRKRRTDNVARRAAAEEEPFCVRPFEYPRQGR